MQEILARINKIAGMRGSMLIAPGGLPIAASFSGAEDSNTLGALAWSVNAALQGTLGKLRRSPMQRYIMNGDAGTAILLSVAAEVLLLVLLRPDVNIGLVLVELKEAARQVTERARL